MFSSLPYRSNPLLRGLLHPARRGRIALALLASAGLISGGVAQAQDWRGAPSGPYVGGPYGYQGYYDPYSQGGYASYGYGPGGYYQGGYGYQGRYAPSPYPQSAYDQTPPPGYGPGYGPAYGYDYPAQRRAWRRDQVQQDQAYQQAPSVPAYDQESAQGGYPGRYPASYRGDYPAGALPPPPPPPAAAPTGPVSTPLAEASAPTTPTVAPPAGAPNVVLARDLVDSAAAYIGYMRKAAAISPAFTDGAGVAKDVKIGAAYEAKQFEEGAIAYAAIVALQEPSFVDGVRQAWGGDASRGQAIASGLLSDPSSALSFTGAEAAAARASSALRRQGDRLLDAGVRVKQAAYDVQHSAWSKSDVVEPQVRLAGAKTLSSTRLSPARDESDKLLKLVLAEQGEGAGSQARALSPVISRGLALAALAVMGQAGQQRSPAVASLLTEEKGGECLKMAKLNLFQCLAVAGPHYEDIFCLGQHAMMDTAQCVIAASGASHSLRTAALSSAPQATQPGVTPAPQDYWTASGERQGSGAGAVPSR